MSSYKSIVIIPTYNEAENIYKIITALQELDLNILIVDDNSPDGTSNIVREMMNSNDKIEIINRKNKLGLGSAYREGFKYSINNGYKYLIQMDADFSHRIEDLEKLLDLQSEYDVLIGSRYIPDGSSKGWSNSRKILSKFANTYAKVITGTKINDMTSGFRIYSDNALNKIEYSKTKSDGYSFKHSSLPILIKELLFIKFFLLWKILDFANATLIFSFDVRESILIFKKLFISFLWSEKS